MNKIILFLKYIFKIYFDISNPYYNKKRNTYINKQFILSNKFDKLITKKITDINKWNTYLNDAEDKTINFLYRHKKINRSLGVWRWKGIIQNKKIISEYVFSGKKGLDFGGAYGPITLDIDILDIQKNDVFGRKIKYNDINLINTSFDYIFSSHTLEHLNNIDEFLILFKKILKKDGALILNLPSYSCKRWRYGIHKNDILNNHLHTFKLSETTNIKLENILNIDTLIEKYFNIKIKKYTGDNSIFILALNNK